jgi:hypothetical protein
MPSIFTFTLPGSRQRKLWRGSVKLTEFVRITLNDFKGIVQVRQDVAAKALDALNHCMTLLSAPRFFGERCAMIPHLPPDALYIRWGRFQAAIQGRVHHCCCSARIARAHSGVVVLSSEASMSNDEEKKPRTEYIYGTTKGVVSQLEFTVDGRTGEIGFGPNIGNTYSETSYERAKGPKVLSRVPQTGETLTFNTFTALRRNYDLVCAVDTNTRTIQGKKVSATAIILVTPSFVGEKEGLREFWRFDVPFCIEMVEVKAAPEKFGWIAAWDEMWNRGIITNEMRVGMIVDSDLGYINRYNQRKAPLLSNFFLRSNQQLIYASSDAGKENVVNKALAAADMVAAQVLQAVETEAALFNQDVAGTEWYERYRIVEPRNVTRL